MCSSSTCSSNVHVCVCTEVDDVVNAVMFLLSDCSSSNVVVM